MNTSTNANTEREGQQMTGENDCEIHNRIATDAAFAIVASTEDVAARLIILQSIAVAVLGSSSLDRGREKTALRLLVDGVASRLATHRLMKELGQ